MTEQFIDLPLADFIIALKRELRIAVHETGNEKPKLSVNKIDLELQVAVTKDESAEGGLKVWVLSLGGKASTSNKQTHTLKLSLDALTETGSKLAINDRSGKPD